MMILPTLLAAAVALMNPTPSVVRVAPRPDGGHQLIVNGEPLFVRGVGGGQSRTAELAALGGNSIRTWGPSQGALEAAAAHGMWVMMGLPLRKARDGFYEDPERVARQLERARDIVRAHRDHPSMLLWGIGNETELGTRETERRITLWKALNDVARMVHEEDPNHPTGLVIAGINRERAEEIRAHCPDIDILCVNAYGNVSGVTRVLNEMRWDIPFLLTEYGPTGHWQVEKTPWGLPIEETSTAKADVYRRAHETVINTHPNSLGGHAFLWGHKQEKTHTWYGILLPGNDELLGAAEALSFAWTGAWPEDRWPRIEAPPVATREDGTATTAPNTFTAGERIRLTVNATDPEGDALEVTWDLRPDASNNPATGGAFEPPTEPIAGAIVEANGMEALVRLPAEAGPYRVFVYARDGKGRAATANLPLLAE